MEKCNGKVTLPLSDYEALKKRLNEAEKVIESLKDDSRSVSVHFRDGHNTRTEFVSSNKELTELAGMLDSALLEIDLLKEEVSIAKREAGYNSEEVSSLKNKIGDIKKRLPLFVTKLFGVERYLC